MSYYIESRVIKTKFNIYNLTICGELLYTIKPKSSTSSIQYYAKSYDYGKTWEIYKEIWGSPKFIQKTKSNVDNIIKLLDKLNSNVV